MDTAGRYALWSVCVSFKLCFALTLPRARAAVSLEAQRVVNEGEPPALCHLILETFDLIVAELLDFAAVDADEVIVMRVPEDVLIHELPLSGVEGLDEPALLQEAERAIDGRATDLLILVPDQIY